MIKNLPYVFLPLLMALCACGNPTQKASIPAAQPLRTSGYTYSCWLNGWRKHKADQSPEILAIQASNYAFTLNLSDFSKSSFERSIPPKHGYEKALDSSPDALSQLRYAELGIALVVDGRRYSATNCLAGRERLPHRLGAAKLWESGRFVQHYEMEGLDFLDATGQRFPCSGSLSLVAWPDSLTLTASITPPISNTWNEARLEIGIKGQDWSKKSYLTIAAPGTCATNQMVSRTVGNPCYHLRKTSTKLAIQTAYGTNTVLPATYSSLKNCFVASVPAIKRSFKTGYTDIRDYDDFRITIDHSLDNACEVPFLLDFRSPANITGLCPLLCDIEGRPTGIPVQLSKNWHYTPMGAYLMAYTSLPAKPGRTEYLLRVSYGFYGTLPSASHSQLSLIGYSGKGGNGRWDQLAIGCWGETFCLDMDMSLVNMAVTDVRMLMTRNGPNGTKWNWTDAGWGGDWFEMLNADGSKLAFKDLKTAYLAHGPCLTDVRYSGFYGAQGEVAMNAEVRTLRTDDYARTFQHFRYVFNVAATNTNISFYRQGRTSEYFTPKIAYGNETGLIAEQDVPLSLKPGQLFIDRLPLHGKGPWWIAFPGAKHTNNRDWGTGSRALVIRSYTATIDGKSYIQPTFSMPVNHVRKESIDVDLVLVPPREIATFHPGDVIDLDVEWITLPRNADDYYGPNEAFQKHLAENPASWKTTYREAVGNDLQVIARGGKVLNRYPILIHADVSTIDVAIKGGVGFVPIRFEGLTSIKDSALFEIVDGKEIRLDQSVHGNDFWQADYDEGACTYALTYNLPLDGKAMSVWRLKSSLPGK